MPYPGAVGSVTLDSLLAGEDLANGRMLVSPQTIEQAFALPTLNTAVIDSGTISPLGRVKSIYIAVTTALVYTTTAPTIRLYVSRVPFTAAGGAGTQLSVNQSLMGAAITAVGLNPALTVTATGMPVGLYVISPSTAGFAELLNHHPFVGVEWIFGGALSAGAMTIFLESAGN